VSDKTCGKCQHWNARNTDVGICTLNPRVWAGSWEYPAQFALDTCSHFEAKTQLAPVVKGKAKSGEKL
jgi:hypothetical protein